MNTQSRISDRFDPAGQWQAYQNISAEILQLAPGKTRLAQLTHAALKLIGGTHGFFGYTNHTAAELVVLSGCGLWGTGVEAIELPELLCAALQPQESTIIKEKAAIQPLAAFGAQPSVEIPAALLIIPLPGLEMGGGILALEHPTPGNGLPETLPLIEMLAQLGALLAVRDNILAMVPESEERTGDPSCYLMPEGPQLLLAQIQDGYFEIASDGRLVYANQAFFDLFGPSAPPTEERYLYDFLSADPAEGRQLFAKLRQHAQSATPCELIVRDGRGQTRNLVATLAGHGAVGESFACYHGILKDATFKTKMAAGLARTKSFLQSIINSCIEGIAATDLQGTLVYASPQIMELTGYTKDALLGTPLANLFRAGEYDVRLIQRALREEGALRDHETQLLTRDGDPLDVSLSVSMLKDEAGAIQGNLLICRDISESKRLEAQLRFSQRMEAIGTLAGGIAHNFNNLLMGIQGNTTLMMLDTEADDSNFKRILNIEKHIQSGARLTRQLIGYAREGKYQVQTIDMNHVIRETCEAFALTKRSISFEYELDPDLPGVMADQGQIEQVLMNLLINAVDAMPDGGRISVETRRISHLDLIGKPYQPAPGHYLSFAITDTGMGMDEETRKRVFEPFFTTKGLDKGNGLGLASCYGIVKAHGGYIDVESQPNRGSCFTIYLPGTEQPLSMDCEGCDQLFTGTETLLLVDDEPMVLEVTREMLEQLGYAVLTAENGGQAMRVFKEKGAAIDLIILDMIMPEMGGDKTFEGLRAYDPSIKVLLASGYSMEGKAATLLDQGCAGFIQKPFDLPVLSKKIREILDGDDQ